MGDGESRRPETRLLKRILICRFVQLTVELLQEGGICARGQPRFFVQQGKDTEFPFDHVNTRLIIGEVYESPVDLFPDVFFLL